MSDAGGYNKIYILTTNCLKFSSRANKVLSDTLVIY